MKGFIKAFLISIFLHHLIITVLYLLPKNPGTNLYGPYVFAYMRPFFSQKWQLFAPDPVAYSTRMYYRCFDSQKKWSAWKDPLENLIKAHQNNRFTPMGKLIYIYQGLFRNLANAKVDLLKKSCEKEKKVCSIPESEIKALPEFKHLNRLVFDICKKENGINKTQFSLARVFSRNFSKRREKGSIGKIETDLFPIINRDNNEKY